MTQNTLEEILILKQVDGLGDQRIKRLIRYAGTVAAVYKLTLEDWEALEGVPLEAYHLLSHAKRTIRIERELAWVKENAISAIGFWEAQYPSALLTISDHPVLLYVRGQLELSKPLLSVVGTRNMTAYGEAVTRALLAGLKPYDPIVVSGLAHGVDACAHRAALQEGLMTWAVLGSGLNRVYPVDNLGLAQQMVSQSGALISEFESETAPERENFPRRNRIVAALSEATIVIEAQQRGGALITAHLARRYGRKVFAVPGRVTDSCSAGCNALLEKGVALYFKDVETLVESLNWKEKAEHKSSDQLSLFVDLTPEEKALLSVLQREEKLHVDELGNRLKISSSKLMQLLFNLEMQNLLKSHPGKYYALL